MKYSTRLDSAVFQLTPTRTRCDLVVSANGKTEKIASGLVNPFLAHLKTAKDQMAKGGYSIVLEPEPGTDAAWFTRGTVERFVRFVSTPDILERVFTLESEILQIEEAIAIQSNNDMGVNTVGDHQAKPVESFEGSKPLLDSSEEKAIVLYKPGAHQPEANQSAAQEGNSKVQLMKVLETRKNVLQKEQGMAFARAVAAGYDIDHMTPLISFAESFGATRLMDACVRFMGLWKRKHETGQWVEIEAAEAMSSRSDIAAMNASGIVLSSALNKQWPGTPESIGEAGVASSADVPPMDHQPSPSHQQYFQGQFPHPMYPPWAMHSPPGTLPVFQGYPMQGIPYYSNYPGNNPNIQPPYPSGEDVRLNRGQRKGQRRRLMDDEDGHIDPETEEVDMELEKETLGNQESGKKSSRSSKRQSGMVVIRNINYITSKIQGSSGSESESASCSETDEEEEDLSATTPNIKCKDSRVSSKRKSNLTKSTDKLDSANMERVVNGNEADGGHWQAFQSYLLKGADEAEHAVDKGLFAMEKNVKGRRLKNMAGDESLLLNGQAVGDNQGGNMTDMQIISGNFGRMTRVAKDASLISRGIGQTSDDGSFMDSQMDTQSTEVDGRRGRYRSANDDFIMHRQENQSGYTNSSSNPLGINGFEHGNKDLGRSSSLNIDDDSYVVSLRSTSADQAGIDGRPAIDMYSEFPSSQPENLSTQAGNKVKYEPDDLTLMPERGSEKGTVGYDPALDYEMQVLAQNGSLSNKKNKEAVNGVRQGAKMMNKDRKSKPDASDKKTAVGPIRRGKPSKLSPLDEAKARAEKLRTFKADLQKLKKEKEEEQIKRLEALKLERQKRIAARGSSIPAQTKKKLPAKLSPSPHKGSKFSDSEPGSVSPLQRLPLRTTSAGSSDSLKASKTSKSINGSHSVGNRLSRSASSLPEQKKGNGGTTPEAKASMTRIRRLSEPKVSSINHVTPMNSRKAEPVSKPKVSNGSESKKISAIMNHDKNKIASLPELKIKTTKAPDVAHGKSSRKEMVPRANEGKSNASFEGSEAKRNDDKISHHSDGDDNPIVEKNVLVLECEKPSVSAVHASSGYVTREETETVPTYAAIEAPVSPLTMDVDKEPKEHQLPVISTAYKASAESASNLEKELPNVSSITIAEKPYQAPFARLSSLEDPSTRNSDYGKAPPSSLQTAAAGAETFRAHISDLGNSKLEKIPEALDKPQVKESPKGFRRLLKFGKKNHATGDRHADLDNVSVNGSELDDTIAKVASSSEVHTLKNLISQDETPTASTTPQKSTSRHFSLLSPFRSKTSEKRQTT